MLINWLIKHVLIITLIVVVVNVNIVKSAPVFGVPLWVAKSKQRAFERIDQCATNEAVRKLCQSCARFKPNKLSYTFCCIDQHRSRHFCRSCIYYDLKVAKYNFHRF